MTRASASLLRYQLERPVGGSGVSSVDVIVIDLTDADGATGLGFTYVLAGGGEVALAAARQQLARHIINQPLLPPRVLWRRIAAGFNRTGPGPNLVALAAIDLAAWDLEAKRRGLPLGMALGGEPRPVAVYGSGGFDATQPPERAAETARAQAARGLRAVKPRVSGVATDAALLRAVRAAVGDDVHVMADANEKCDLASAIWLSHAARDEGVLFLEEPLPASAVDGYRALASCGGAAIAAGEHLQGTSAFRPFIVERLAAIVQPDLAMAGGITPILDLCTLCEAFDLPVSPHFLPGLFAHVAAVSPAVRWLEEFPLLEPLFDGWPLRAPDGTLRMADRPGHGLLLPGDRRAHFAISES